MRSRITYITLALAVSALALPLATHAASIPFFGPIIDNGLQTCALGWGAVLLVVNNIIRLALTILVFFIAPLVIAYAGFLLVVNAVNPHGKEEAKKMITNLVVGLVIALSAWLIVDMIMATFYNGTFGSWSEIIRGGGAPTCLTLATGLNQAPALQYTGSQLPGFSTTPQSGGGVCILRTTGSCAVSGLSIFGAAANQASIVCSAESGNGTLLQGDFITPPSADAGNPVSFGLFQINISANPVGGLNCPSAFSAMYRGSNRSVVIVDPALYTQCKFAALDPAQNIVAAHQIYVGAGNKFIRWSAAKRCGIAFGSSPTLAKACELISPT